MGGRDGGGGFEGRDQGAGCRGGRGGGQGTGDANQGEKGVAWGREGASSGGLINETAETETVSPAERAR